MNIDKEVEAFKAQLELLNYAGIKEVAWLVLDANADKTTQLTNVGMLKNIFPDLMLFASSADTPEGVIADLENYLEKVKANYSSLKVAKKNAEAFELKLGV